MTLRFNLFLHYTLHQNLQPRFYPYPSSDRAKSLVQCAKDRRMGDGELASDFARQVAKVNALTVQKEEAMKKSRELLFMELCRHLGVEGDELRNKWKKISEEDKWVLIIEFVRKWEDSFKPLSATSVKEMMEEYFYGDRPSPSPGSVLFPGLRKMMGFPPE